MCIQVRHLNLTALAVRQLLLLQKLLVFFLERVRHGLLQLARLISLRVILLHFDYMRRHFFIEVGRVDAVESERHDSIVFHAGARHWALAI